MDAHPLVHLALGYLSRCFYLCILFELMVLRSVMLSVDSERGIFSQVQAKMWQKNIRCECSKCGFLPSFVSPPDSRINVRILYKLE